jgi:uncharacterized membrane protein
LFPPGKDSTLFFKKSTDEQRKSVPGIRKIAGPVPLTPEIPPDKITRFSNLEQKEGGFMTGEITVKKLQVLEVIKSGLEIGVKNMGPILVNTLLWLVTIWIPYLNIGTTIGMVAGILVKASKEETISMTEIFNPQYRKYMGEFFLTAGLVGMGTAMGFALFIIPGCVIAIAWSLSLLLVVDKEKNPTEAISLSNKLTYGNKAAIFLASLIVMVAVIIVSCVLGFIPKIGPLLVFVVAVLAVFVSIGIGAYIYRTLCGDLQ